MNPEISVIIPVYKVEKYLKKCLESVRNQTYTDWECILVDDGSPDASGAICDEYAIEDSRFRVIHRQNGGLPAARNEGLRVCKGKYISFVDSDDVLYKDYLSHLHELIINYDADVAQVSMSIMFTTFERKKRLVETITVLDRGQIAKEMLRGKIVPNYAWNKLYKREVIDTLYKEGMVYEDIYTLPVWTKNIHKMVISPEPLYLYRQRKSSIMHINTAKNRFDYLNAIVHQVEVLRNLEPDAVSEDIAAKCLWKGVIHAAKNMARNIKSPQERYEAVCKVREIAGNQYSREITNLGLKRWFRVNLLLKNPAAFIRLMRFVTLFDFHKQHSEMHLFD